MQVTTTGRNKSTVSVTQPTQMLIYWRSCGFDNYAMIAYIAVKSYHEILPSVQMQTHNWTPSVHVAYVRSRART